MLDVGLNYVNGSEELWLAAYYGDACKLESLLANPEYRARINHTINLSHDHSPLFFACYGASNAKTVRLLLEAGADPFQRDNLGRLPLHYAANSMQKEIIDALLEIPNMKAHRLDAVSANAQTPLHALFLPSLGVHYAVRADNSKIAACLDSMLDPDRDASKRAMERLDLKGLNSFMLVKHYKLGPWFPSQHVPPRMFENYLRCFVTVPANISELLASDLCSQIPQTDPVSLKSRLESYANSQKLRSSDAIIFTGIKPVDSADLFTTINNTPRCI